MNQNWVLPLAIVIPVKNNLQGLKDTLELIWQIDPLYETIEIAIIDAGTCPETNRWLLQQSHRIAHIRSAQDDGVYDAMNYGKNTVNAKWVWFIGAGDLPEKNSLQAILSEIRNWNADKIHIFGVDIAQPESGVPSHYPARWDHSMIWRNTSHHQGIFYPSSLLKLHSFNCAFKVLADYGMHLSLFLGGIEAQLHPTSICSVESGGVSRRFDVKLYKEEWALKKNILKGPVKWAHPFWLLFKYLVKKSGMPTRA
jgi:glycosyltransferase involved in cell wall biosynthesis